MAPKHIDIAVGSTTINLQLFGILGAAALLTPGGASLQIEQISGSRTSGGWAT